MTAALLSAGALAGALATGLVFGLWLRRETQRGDAAEASLVAAYALASNAALDAEHAQEALEIARERHGREVDILRDRIAAAEAIIEKCRDPATVLDALREALK